METGLTSIRYVYRMFDLLHIRTETLPSAYAGRLLWGNCTHGRTGIMWACSRKTTRRISFAYDANEGLDQSEPAQNRRMERRTPRNFLDNLLPDNRTSAQAMREHLNASSAGVFDLRRTS